MSFDYSSDRAPSALGALAGRLEGAPTVADSQLPSFRFPKSFSGNGTGNRSGAPPPPPPFPSGCGGGHGAVGRQGQESAPGLSAAS